MSTRVAMMLLAEVEMAQLLWNDDFPSKIKKTIIQILYLPPDCREAQTPRL